MEPSPAPAREPSPEPPPDDIPLFTARDDFDSSKPMERSSRAPMALAEQATALSPPHNDLSKIEEVKVAMDHNGLLILHDEEHGGTFILLALND